MASLAILIGIYSYFIFGLGILGLLYRQTIIYLSVLFWGLAAWFLVKKGKRFNKLESFRELAKDKVCLGFFLLLLFQVVVNLVGALGPELGFDALWYHLTLPKIYLQTHKISFIPNGLLYYSAMPKLVEMLYTAALAIEGEVLVKIIHFTFGILSAVGLFKLSRKYLSVRTSLIVVSVFYSCLVVGWQSITAYVDLGRTFFEILALSYFLRWFEEDKIEYLVESSVMLGLAISTKLLALGSLFIFIPLIFLKTKKEPKKMFRSFLLFLLFSLLVPLPWFVFSYIHTNNPFYPVFGGILNLSHNISIFNFLNFFKDFYLLFMQSADPLSPVFLISFPLIFIYFKKLRKTGKSVFLYCFFGYLIWYLIPRTGGGRFILPYLPAYSLAVGFIYEASNLRLKKILLVFVFLSAGINLGYRALANYKYLPVILGQQSKNKFLSENLNFNFGDFYDVDGYFQHNIDKNDLVLIYGVHNLYYVDFPYIHESWAKPGIPVTHILVKDGSLPEKFGTRRLIYRNNLTGVNLYLFGENLP